MCTFDAALFDLYDEGLISFEEAIRNADSANELRLNIKLKSKRGEPKATDFGGLSLNPMTQPADLEEREHQKMLKKHESRRRARKSSSRRCARRSASPRPRRRRPDGLARGRLPHVPALPCTAGALPAARARKRMTRRLISSGSTFERDIGYSRAVVDGEWVFVSGTTGFDYATMTLPEGVVEQAEQCLGTSARPSPRPARASPTSCA